MGSCFSSEVDPITLYTAKIISLDGALRELPLPATAAQALLSEPSDPACFLCNSDKLYFDQRIPAVDPDDELQAGQIYFVLPASKRQYPLTASDMAALAMKASVAMAAGPKTSRRKKFRVSPIVTVAEAAGDMDEAMKKFETVRPSVSRSGSVRRFQRSASRRARLAIRSFRLRLSTINEGSILE